MNPDDWLPAAAQTSAATGRLVVLPHAGSGTAPWFRWRSRLPGDIELRVARLPGRENRLGESPLTFAPAAIAALASALRQLPPLPLVLFGHSLGALLAYGVCLALPDTARALVVSGQIAPDLTPPYRDLRGMSDAQLAQAVNARWQAIPPMILDEPEALAIFVPALRADLALADSFPAGPALPLDIPLYVLAGLSDTLDEHGIGRWLDRTRGAVQLVRHPGGHMAVLEDPAVTDEIVSICLRRLP